MAYNKNRIKTTVGSMVFDSCNFLFLTLLMFVTLYPFWHVLMASMSNPAALTTHRGMLFFPLARINFGGYRIVFQNPNIPMGYKNTLIYLSLGTSINMLMTIMAAFALSRKHLMVRSFVMYVIIFTMYFSGGLIPNYLNVRELGLYNTVWAIVLPGAISTYNMIIMRTAFAAVPDSMEESAKLDGANDLVVLVRILLPLCIPTIAVIVLFYGVGHWNSWFNAMIYLKDRQKYPIQLVLREILRANSNALDAAGSGGTVADAGVDRLPIGETVKFATIIVTTVPVLFVYPFLQKYFVKGVMVGAIKG